MNRILASIFSVVPLIGWSSLSWGADWRKFGANEEATYYYDAEQINYHSKYIVKIWVKMDLSPLGINLNVARGGELLRGWASIVAHYEIDCYNPGFNFVYGVAYSPGGSVLYSGHLEGLYNQVIPGSIWENLHKAACLDSWKTREFYKDLYILAPNWQKINKDPAFDAWLKRRIDPSTKKDWRVLLDEAFEKRNPGKVAAFFLEYAKVLKDPNPLEKKAGRQLSF